ncbi:MAG: RDD family protein [Chloroflexota bacterium]
MTNSNDILKIDTPENVTFDYDVAGIGSRFLAALIDTSLIGLGQVIVFGALFLLLNNELDSALGSIAVSWIIASLGLVSFVFLWGYYIGFELFWNGQSPGKRWVGLRVIRVDGTPITLTESAIRNLVRLIDLLPMAYGVGVVTMFINSNSRRVGDLAAGTVVVYDRRETGLGDLAPVNPGVWAATISPAKLPEEFPLEKLTRHEVDVIEEFLHRRDDLSNRRELARHLLEALVGRLGLSRETMDFDRADDLLAAIYKRVRSRNAE